MRQLYLEQWANGAAIEVVFYDEPLPGEDPNDRIQLLITEADSARRGWLMNIEDAMAIICGLAKAVRVAVDRDIPARPAHQGGEEMSLREQLADVQHEIWSSWMRWMFTTGEFNPDGTWTMPAAKVERWQRQLATPYAALSEAEKDSDREQADKILPCLRDAEIDRLATYLLEHWSHEIGDESAVDVAIRLLERLR